MKKLLAFLTFLLFLLFLLLIWFAWNWYKENVACCPETVVEVKHGPLYYECNSDNPITSSEWTKKKSEILSAKAEGKNLLIIAPAYKGEKEEIALLRAEKVAELFQPPLSDKEVAVDMRTIDVDCETAQKDPLGKTLFKWVTRNDYVIEHHDRTYIYFKYNTDKEIDIVHVVDYLDNLANELKSTGKTVKLIGHTDADGDDAYNMELGLKRANRIKKDLMNRGVAEDKIFVESRGKREPIDTNGTPEGKQKNRRVEIKIN